MRFVTAAAVLALTLSAGVAVAADEALSPEAQAGVDIAKQYAKTDKIKFRKVKVGADGKVCGKVAVGADADIEFIVDPSDQTLWLNEGAQEPESVFAWGNKIVRGGGDRKAFQVWKACQAGK
ncbi:hypothetical protein [Caulobacter sp. NIBR1757]|uniref:hypothetical protein n=1 Tax=Caulobacter sp. NIBR1757 TaxID=3016000 RepID=UPI0022F0C65C|nr:hypothetical protein [Caulobacter sp. NIBR1757]WGM39293.1 hypothetical protein AMEJIAPC_02210 [Caulobacter sp. NIBR1757]